MTYPRTVLVALACALVALVGGLWLGGHPTSLPDFARNAFVDDDRALRAEVLDTIEDNYYKKIGRKDLENRSIKSLVQALGDPFTHYLTPKEARTFVDSVQGRFEGVGMSVEEDRRGLRVLNVFQGSPARKAGIRKGDLITAVNGRSISGVNSEVATGRIKGPAGTSVRLEVSSGAERPHEVRVRRARINVPLVEGSVHERNGVKLGVVRLLSFSDGAHGEVADKVLSLQHRGARGIILDLRGNGGGLLREAVLVSSIFLEDGKIVSIKGRTRTEKTESAVGRSVAPKVPLVVLVDGGSASASEIVAGALRDRHRGTLVGTRSFGKGLVQEVEPLSNGGVLDLTVANYYLPSGHTIKPRKGLVPQVKARDDPKTHRDEALPTALRVLLQKTQR